MNELLKKLIKELKEINYEGVNFELSNYNTYTNLSWINIRGVAVPMKNSLHLPQGAKWINENTILYKAREIHLVPLP